MSAAWKAILGHSWSKAWSSGLRTNRGGIRGQASERRPSSSEASRIMAESCSFRSLLSHSASSWLSGICSRTSDAATRTLSHACRTHFTHHRCFFRNAEPRLLPLWSVELRGLSLVLEDLFNQFQYTSRPRFSAVSLPNPGSRAITRSEPREQNPSPVPHYQMERDATKSPHVTAHLLATVAQSE